MDVHHIVPEADDGPDTEDNAAPLCPNCHAWLGANPEKRKQIGQMRDWWYETCDRLYGGHEKQTLRKLDELITLARSHNADLAAQRSLIEEFGGILRCLVEEAGRGESDAVKAMASKVNAVVTATTLAQGVHANVQCRNCGTYVGLLIGSNVCPTCGAPI